MTLRLGTFSSDVRSIILAGLSTASSAVVVAADSVLAAIGKLQAQVSLRAPLDSPPLTGNATLTGATTATTAQLYVVPPGGSLLTEAKVRLGGTFATGVDTGVRLVASLRTGFSTGAWGTEYFDLWLNDGSPNDAATDASQVRAARFARTGLTIGYDTAASSNLVLNSATATTRTIAIQTASSSRWTIAVNGTAEAGSNAGSNFAIQARDDAGVLLTNPLQITRSSGLVTMNAGAAISGGASSIDGATVGASSASTGAFTTLSASSTVSGAGFTSRFASPGPVGSTAASTGAFTTLTTTANATVGGNLTVGGTTVSANITAYLNAAAGYAKTLSFQTAGSARFQFATNNVAEGGSNAGSDFTFNRYSDAGANIGTVFSVTRSTGLMLIPNADINAGTIDGAAVGASVPSTGAFTTLTSSGAATFSTQSPGDSSTLAATTAFVAAAIAVLAARVTAVEANYVKTD